MAMKTRQKKLGKSRQTPRKRHAKPAAGECVPATGWPVFGGSTCPVPLGWPKFTPYPEWSLRVSTRKVSREEVTQGAIPVWEVYRWHERVAVFDSEALARQFIGFKNREADGAA